MASFPIAVITAAQNAQKAYPPVPASVTLAQWAVESAWGKSMPVGSNNPFGIKALNGEPCVVCMTHEISNGQRVTVQAKFRKFPSTEDAFMEHSRLLATSPLYARARAARTARGFARALTGVYATDPKYGDTLITIINSYSLTNYDVLPKAASVDTPKEAPRKPVEATVVVPAITIPADPQPPPTALTGAAQGSLWADLVSALKGWFV